MSAIYIMNAMLGIGWIVGIFEHIFKVYRVQTSFGRLVVKCVLDVKFVFNAIYAKSELKNMNCFKIY